MSSPLSIMHMALSNCDLFSMVHSARLPRQPCSIHPSYLRKATHMLRSPYHVAICHSSLHRAWCGAVSFRGDWYPAVVFSCLQGEEPPPETRHCSAHPLLPAESAGVAGRTVLSLSTPLFSEPEPAELVELADVSPLTLPDDPTSIVCCEDLTGVWCGGSTWIR